MDHPLQENGGRTDKGFTPTINNLISPAIVI